MTYEIELDRENDKAVLKNSSGEIVNENLELPLQTPEDIIDFILEDMGVGTPQKKAFKVLFTKDWEISEKGGA